MNALYLFLNLADVPTPFLNAERVLGLSRSGHSLLELKHAAEVLGLSCSVRACSSSMDMLQRSFPIIVCTEPQAFAESSVHRQDARPGHFLVVIRVEQGVVYFLDTTTGELFHRQIADFTKLITGHFLESDRHASSWLWLLVGASLLALMWLTARQRFRRYFRPSHTILAILLSVSLPCSALADDARTIHQYSKEIWRAADMDDVNSLYLLLKGLGSEPRYCDVLQGLRTSGGTSTMLDLKTVALNCGARLTITRCNPIDLLQDHLPAIVQLRDVRSTQSEFAVVFASNNSSVFWISAGYMRFFVGTRDEFFRSWTGYAMVAEGPSHRHLLVLGSLALLFVYTFAYLWRRHALRHQGHDSRLRRVLSSSITALAVIVSLQGVVIGKDLPPEITKALSSSAKDIDGLLLAWTMTSFPTECSQDDPREGKPKFGFLGPVTISLAEQNGLYHVLQDSVHPASGEDIYHPTAVNHVVREFAFDGINHYVGLPKSKSGSTASILIEPIGPSIQSKPLVESFCANLLFEIGFRIPHLYRDHCLNGPRSLLLSLIADGAELVTIDTASNEEGLLGVNLRQDGILWRFVLDEKLNYAVRSMEQRTATGALVKMSVPSRFEPVHGAPSVWLPRGCDVTYFGWEGRGPWEAAIHRQKYVVAKCEKRSFPPGEFILAYTDVGTLVHDRSAAAEGEEGAGTYRYPASPSDLDRVMLEVRSKHLLVAPSSVRKELLVSIVCVTCVGVYFATRRKH